MTALGLAATKTTSIIREIKRFSLHRLDGFLASVLLARASRRPVARLIVSDSHVSARYEVSLSFCTDDLNSVRPRRKLCFGPWLLLRRAEVVRSMSVTGLGLDM